MFHDMLQLPVATSDMLHERCALCNMSPSIATCRHQLMGGKDSTHDVFVDIITQSVLELFVFSFFVVWICCLGCTSNAF
jgi:hypothetical protein